MIRQLCSFGGLVLLGGTLVFLTPGPGRAQSGGGRSGGSSAGALGGPRPEFSSGRANRGGLYPDHPNLSRFPTERSQSPWYPGTPARPSYGSTPYPSGYGSFDDPGLISGPGSNPYNDDRKVYPYNDPSRQPDLGGGSSRYSLAPRSGYDALPSAAPDRTAHLRVRVPAEAQVWLNGMPTTSPGTLRAYQSPALDAGGRYAYEVRARWIENGKEVTQTQQVGVSAGASVDVRFPAPSGR